MHKTFIPSKKNDYQPLILRPKNLFILAVILVVIKFLLFSWFFYFPQTSNFAVVTSAKLIELVEQERVVNNLNELKINDKLTKAAQEKAQDMLENNYFAHTSPSGITPWYWFNKVGYNYVAAGENLAKDFTDSEYLHRAWMNSPSHRANILNGKYDEVGIAVLEGEMNGKKTIVAVQLFGKAASVKKTAPKIVQSNTTPSNVGIALPKPETNLPENVAANQELTQTGVQTEEIVTSPISTTIGESIRPSENQFILNEITEKSEPFAQKIYFIIAGLASLVLLLTVFVNIRIQYPRLILASIIFIVLIAGIASFNAQSFLNKNIDTLDGASVERIIP